MKNCNDIANNKRRPVDLRSALCILLLAAAVFAGCGQKQPQERKLEFPTAEEVAESMEEQGYEVERFDSFEELDSLKTTRIKAVQGEKYLDICYGVETEDDINRIIDYYSSNYKNYNLFSNVDTVFCYSGQDVIQTAGLDQYE